MVGDGEGGSIADIECNKAQAKAKYKAPMSDALPGSLEFILNPLLTTLIAGKVMFYLLGYWIAVIAGFLFTWLLGFNDPEE